MVRWQVWHTLLSFMSLIIKNNWQVRSQMYCVSTRFFSCTLATCGGSFCCTLTPCTRSFSSCSLVLILLISDRIQYHMVPYCSLQPFKLHHTRPYSMIRRLFSVAIFMSDRQYCNSHALSRQMSSATVSVVMLREFLTWLGEGGRTGCRGCRTCTLSRVLSGVWVLPCGRGPS